MKRMILLLAALMLLTTCALAQPSDDYEAAMALLGEGRYAEAAEAFDQINTYADAPRYAMYARAIAAAEQGEYDMALLALTGLGSFMDAPQQLTYYTALQLEKQGEYYQAADTYESILFFRDSLDRIYLCSDLYMQQKYEQASALEQEGKLTEALKTFEQIEGYLDSAARADAVRASLLQQAYASAAEMEQTGDLAGAYDAFLALESYQDAAQRAEAIRLPVLYQKTWQFIAKGQYADAYTAVLKLGDYEKSAELAYMLRLTKYAQLNRLSDKAARITFHDACGLLDFEHLTILQPKWEDIGLMSDSVFWAKEYGLYTILDCSGEPLTNSRFKAVSAFRDGLATVAMTYVKDDNLFLFGLVNEQGEAVTDPSWMELGASSGDTICTPVFSASGLIRVRGKNGYGLMDKTGRLVVEPMYSAMSDFEQGVSIVCLNNQWGLLAEDGSVVLEPCYDAIHAFAHGYAAVKKGLQWGYINLQGEEVIAPKFAEAEDFTVGGTADVRVGKYWHIINEKGERLYFGQEEAAPTSVFPRLSGELTESMLLPAGLSFGMTWDEISQARPNASRSEYSSYIFMNEYDVALFDRFDSRVTFYLNKNDKLNGIYYSLTNASIADYENVKSCLESLIGGSVVVPNDRSISFYINTGALVYDEGSASYIREVEPYDYTQLYIADHAATPVIMMLDWYESEYEGETYEYLNLYVVRLSSEALNILDSLGVFDY